MGGRQSCVRRQLPWGEPPCWRDQADLPCLISSGARSRGNPEYEACDPDGGEAPPDTGGQRVFSLRGIPLASLRVRVSATLPPPPSLYPGTTARLLFGSAGTGQRAPCASHSSSERRWARANRNQKKNARNNSTDCEYLVADPLSSEGLRVNNSSSERRWATIKVSIPPKIQKSQR